MKTFILFTLFFFSISYSYSQDYQLLPDSCTYCVYKVTQGGSSFYNANYKVDPANQVQFNGVSYTKVEVGANFFPEIGVRQVGNKLYGATQDSINEFLIMDFDAAVGDTIFDLYSETYAYDARVLIRDSMLVNNGVYHHYRILEGFNVTQNGNPANNVPFWYFRWNERGICSSNLVQENMGSEVGGILFNIPDFHVIGVLYSSPQFCTTDPLYNNPNAATCDNCNLQYSSINESILETFSISPNPVQNDLKIDFEVVGKKDISIYNSLGSKVFHKQTVLNNTLINVASFESGVYIIEVESNGQVRRKRLVVE